jgi:hypothetical protein
VAGTGNVGNLGGADLGVVDTLRKRVVLDEPSPTPLPPQGHPRLAAAEEFSLYESRTPSASTQLGQRDVGTGTSDGTDSGAGEGGASASYTSLGEIVAAYDWPLNEAFAVVDCESSWNPLAVSWDGSSYGLFQIWAGHAWRWLDFWEEWMNPSRNAEYAYELWAEQGWGIWGCYGY